MHLRVLAIAIATIHERSRLWVFSSTVGRLEVLKRRVLGRARSGARASRLASCQRDQRCKASRRRTRTRRSLGRSWCRPDNRWGKIREPAWNVGVFVEVIAGADAMVSVRDRERSVAPQATTHQQHRGELEGRKSTSSPAPASNSYPSADERGSFAALFYAATLVRPATYPPGPLCYTAS